MSLDPKAIGKCRGCGKTILWGVDDKGTRIPLDFAAPIYATTLQPNGSVLLKLLPSADRKQDLKAGCGQPGDVTRSPVAVSHFATCPKANDFSRSKT